MECTEHGKKKRKKSNDVVSWAASVPPLLYGPPEANKWAPLINVPQLFLLCHQHWMMTLIFGFSPVPCCGVAVGPPAQKPMTNSNHGPSKKPWSSAYYFSFLYQRTAAGHKKARDKQEHKDGRAGVDAVAPMDADFSSGRLRGLVGHRFTGRWLIFIPLFYYI